MKILVTGGAGFIGSNFIGQRLQQYKDDQIICLDALTYAGNTKNLQEIQENSRFNFFQGRIQDKNIVESILKKYRPQALINFAAETHVDRSLHQQEPFFDTNVRGVEVLLHAANQLGVQRFVHISTDEVYGSLATGVATEEWPLNPTSPYAKSKAQADEVVLGFFRLNKNMDVMITRCANNFGPFQHPEKFIPLAVTNLLEGKKIPLYGTGKNIRNWIYVLDHCQAINLVLERGKAGEVYNIGSPHEISNTTVLQHLLELLGREWEAVELVKDREQHDLRYALDYTKIQQELGWKSAFSFQESLQKTVLWYLEHTQWWKTIKDSPEFCNYVQKHYVEKHGMNAA